MKKPYTPPEIEKIGSVEAMTQTVYKVGSISFGDDDDGFFDDDY
jgi:hypothetical protein